MPPIVEPSQEIDASSPAGRARDGDYAERGDYHRHLDPHWSYAPIYERKVRWVDRCLEGVKSEARILDVGAGEGALVARYRDRGLTIEGVDAAYASDLVRRADLRTLPYDDGAFDVVLFLDVLEHVPLLEQSAALHEVARVIKPGGTLFMSVPNLAHLHSRLKFLLAGKLTRTSAVDRHPGDRPVAEYLELLAEARLEVVERGGIFPTLPIAFRAVNRQPKRWGWLVGALDAVVPGLGLRFLATIQATKPPR